MGWSVLQCTSNEQFSTRMTSAHRSQNDACLLQLFRRLAASPAAPMRQHQNQLSWSSAKICSVCWCIPALLSCAEGCLCLLAVSILYSQPLPPSDSSLCALPQHPFAAFLPHALSRSTPPHLPATAGGAGVGAGGASDLASRPLATQGTAFSDDSIIHTVSSEDIRHLLQRQ